MNFPTKFKSLWPSHSPESLRMARPWFKFLCLNPHHENPAGSAPVRRRPVGGGHKVVRDFKMDEVVKWSGGFVTAKHVEGGVLSVETVKGNSMLSSAVFNAFAATPSQHIELELQSDVAGVGSFFWAGNTNTIYGGFAGTKRTMFAITPGLQTYRVEPFWQGEKRIIHLRLDFPEQQGGHYLIKALRIVEDLPGAAVALPLHEVKLEAGAWRGRLNWTASRGAILSLRLKTAPEVKGEGRVSFGQRRHQRDASNGFSPARRRSGAYLQYCAR